MAFKQYIEEVWAWGELQHIDTIWAHSLEQALKGCTRNTNDAFPDNDFINKVYEVKEWLVGKTEEEADIMGVPHG